MSGGRCWLREHGYLRTEDLREAGFDPKRLVDYEQRGMAERVSYGVYRMNAIPTDELDGCTRTRSSSTSGLHDSRHTALSHWLDAGISMDEVSKYMGHAYITITIDRYGHLLPGGKAEAAEPPQRIRRAPPLGSPPMTDEELDQPILSRLRSRREQHDQHRVQRTWRPRSTSPSPAWTPACSRSPVRAESKSPPAMPGRWMIA